MAKELLGLCALLLLLPAAGDAADAAGRGPRVVFALTGPPDYMPCLPFTRQPVADAWAVNLDFLEYLRQALED